MEQLVFKTNFYFIRHGETDWNRLRIGQGQTDIPLNDRGIEQAHTAAAQLKDKQIVSIVTSPLKRAAKTAEIIGQHISCPVTVIDDLKECSWGIIEGKHVGDGTLIQSWRDGGHIQGAESFAHFTDRVMRGLKQALEMPGPVLVVAHGAVHWAMCSALALSHETLPNCVPIFHSVKKDALLR